METISSAVFTSSQKDARRAGLLYLAFVVTCIFALLLAIILIDVPMLLAASSEALYYFLIGIVFNLARFLFLGTAIGYLYKKL